MHGVSKVPSKYPHHHSDKGEISGLAVECGDISKRVNDLLFLCDMNLNVAFVIHFGAIVPSAEVPLVIPLQAVFRKNDEEFLHLLFEGVRVERFSFSLSFLACPFKCDQS